MNEPRGQNDDRPPSKTPDEGHAATVDQPQVGNAGKRELAGQFGGQRLQSLRGAERALEHRIETERANQADRSAEEKTRHPSEKDARFGLVPIEPEIIGDHVEKCTRRPMAAGVVDRGRGRLGGRFARGDVGRLVATCAGITERGERHSGG